jgi:ribosome biogenesis GTPase A
MSINWFPGHMVAAVDKAKEAMAAHDLVIEVLDARCPGASGNPLVERLRMARQRPCLKVLNKADIADPAVTTAWLAHYNAQKNVTAIAISCKKNGDALKVLASARKLAPHRNDNFKPLRMLIMGVPNVGKSTLINALLKRKIAKTGDEPAVTKILHRYDLSSTMQLTDTPGLMWPNIKNPSDGLMLAASHVIGTNAYIESEVAVYLADLLIARYPQVLKERYGFAAVSPEATAAAAQRIAAPRHEAEPAEAADDGVAVIEAIAKKRGYLLKGKGVDFDKAAIALLVDYRVGALGRISLETAETRAAMLAAREQPAVEDDDDPEDKPAEQAPQEDKAAP